MLYPEFLKKGDFIGVPAPSNGSDSELDVKKYKNAKCKLEDIGYNVRLSKNIFNSRMARSADEFERSNELNKMFEDESKMIMCASGGEFLVEILSFVDFSKLKNNPKWVQGFSDPTGLLFPITTKYDIATIYSNNFKSFGTDKYDKSLNDNLKVITGNIVEQESFELFEGTRKDKVTGLEGYNLTDKVCWKTLDEKNVNVSGRIFAGCLDIIIELVGTRFDGSGNFIEKYKEDGIIWCFDNCELSKEELIRCLWRLNEIGFFKYTKAVVFGRNGIDISSLNYDMKNTLKDSILPKLNIPVIYDADISHKGPSMTIINGAMAELKINKGTAKLNFKLI